MLVCINPEEKDSVIFSTENVKSINPETYISYSDETFEVRDRCVIHFYSGDPVLIGLSVSEVHRRIRDVATDGSSTKYWVCSDANQTLFPSPFKSTYWPSFYWSNRAMGVAANTTK